MLVVFTFKFALSHHDVGVSILRLYIYICLSAYFFYFSSFLWFLHFEHWSIVIHSMNDAACELCVMSCQTNSFTLMNFRWSLALNQFYKPTNVCYFKTSKCYSQPGSKFSNLFLRYLNCSSFQLIRF